VGCDARLDLQHLASPLVSETLSWIADSDARHESVQTIQCLRASGPASVTGPGRIAIASSARAMPTEQHNAVMRRWRREVDIRAGVCEKEIQKPVVLNIAILIRKVPRSRRYPRSMIGKSRLCGPRQLGLKVNAQTM